MYFHPAENFFQKVLDSELEYVYCVLVNGEQARQAPRFRFPLSLWRSAMAPASLSLFGWFMVSVLFGLFLIIGFLSD